jgi:hypothetical protein
MQALNDISALYAFVGKNSKFRRLMRPYVVHDKTVTREVKEHYAAWLESQERKGDKVVEKEIARSCWWQLKMLREAN